MALLREAIQGDQDDKCVDATDDQARALLTLVRYGLFEKTIAGDEVTFQITDKGRRFAA